MWILPKQLHTSDFVPDTEALNLDSNESSRLCAQSLFVRSKPSRVPTWLQKWKRDTWTQHLFGRILNPSHGQTFVTAWTSLLVVTPASHSAPQEIDSAKTIPATSGPLSQMEFDFCAPSFASLKTSTATSALDSEKLSKNWKDLVTQRRGEYLARAKSARHTDANGSSSWPTATARDWKGAYRPESLIRSDGKSRAMDTLNQAVITVQNWPPQLGHPAPAKPSTGGNRQESWATPRAGKTTDENPETWAKRQAQGNVATMPLTAQVKCWATPTARDHKSGRGQEERDYKELTPMVERTQSGKLNPRWVETLMGLPVGWTMPSCLSPVTIIQTNSDSLETE